MTTSRTLDRLRDTTTALGATVSQQDLPELRLSAADRQPAARRGARLPWPQLTGRALVPLAAAATVLAIALSLTVAGRDLRSPGLAKSSPSSPPAGQTTPVSPIQRSIYLPRYLVTVVQGRGYIRSRLTGKVVATIESPAKDFAVEGVAVALWEHTFYLAGTIPVSQGAGGTLIKFFRFSLSASGHPGRPVAVPGPPGHGLVPVSSDGLKGIPLALSPDGTELAWATDSQLYPGDSASYPPTIWVRNTVTGATRSWRTWPSSISAITSLSWATGGQLGYAADFGDSAVSGGSVVRQPGHVVAAFAVLDTTAPGSGLTGDSKLVAYGQYRSWPAGTQSASVYGGVLSHDGLDAFVLIGPDGGNRLVEVAVASGQTVQILLHGSRAKQAVPSGIDGRYILVPAGPRHRVRPSGHYVCGQLLGITLTAPTVRLTPLPFPLYCSTVAPVPATQARW